MTILPRLRFVCLSAVLLLITSGVALAQHDPVTGGGMIGGSTERSSKPQKAREQTGVNYNTTQTHQLPHQ